MSSLAGTPEPLPQLIGAIYEAALEQGDWEALLPRMLTFCGAPRGILGFASTTASKFDVVLAHDALDPALMQRADEEFQNEDPMLNRGILPPGGSVFRNSWYIRRDEYHAMPVYQACYRPLGAEKHLVAILDNQAGSGSFFGAYRAEWEPDFLAEDFDRFQAIAAHLVRAATIQEKLAAHARASDASLAALSLLPFAIYALDCHGRVVLMNARAESLARERDGFSVRGDKLVAPGSERAALEAAILGARNTAWSRGETGAALLRVRRPSGRRAYQVMAIPVAERPSVLLSRTAAGQALVLVLVSDPESAPEPAVETLRSLFGLTPALARLAAALAAGKTVREFADEHAVTEETARFYLKELMARVGVHRQAELVRVLLSGVAQLGMPSAR